MPEVDWHSYGLVVSSGYRKKVLVSLKDGPRTPKEISEVAKLRLSHISHTLAELSTLGLVECLTPKLKKGRLFGLTVKGKTIGKRLELS